MSRAVIGTALCTLGFAALAFAGTTASKNDKPRSQWPPENLSGHIDMVDTANHLLIVKDSSGTTFDFKVTPATRIREDGAKATLPDLSAKTNDEVTVHFVPERRGDIAESIKLNQ
jgi:hypothetical protein